MKTLGVILAGGQSRRFGSDKAQAMLGGRTLLDHAISAIRPHCDAFAIVGRPSFIALALDDWPEPGLGPLGGIAAALRYAAEHSFAQVISIPVDCVSLPLDIRGLLEPAPSYIATQPVIGCWPTVAAQEIENMLGDGGNRAVRAFAERIGARAVSLEFDFVNINRASDLELLSAGRKTQP